jgi:hypothetical protein
MEGLNPAVTTSADWIPLGRHAQHNGLAPGVRDKNSKLTKTSQFIDQSSVDKIKETLPQFAFSCPAAERRIEILTIPSVPHNLAPV